MGLAKMAPDGWVYYAREVAAGAEDYFLGHGEEPGRWIGRAAEGLGLTGGVDEEHLARLFGQSCHPVTGAPLGRATPPGSSAVTGFALSFSPPKSVSILWALGADEVVSRVRDGHDAAVATALEFLQDHACFTRRGHAGAVQEPGRGYVGTAFTHRTSRAGDPQLHTHILVANRVQSSIDGRWLSLDGRELFEAQKAAGMLYKAALRAELVARLGVSWGEVDANGGAEITGVPHALVEHFSKRRAQVEAAAARLVGERETALGRSLTGDERAAAYQLATYQSRAAKGEGGETTSGLRARWRAEADATGLGPGRWAGEVFRKRRVTRREAVLRRLGLTDSLDLAVTEAIEQLERTHATWGRSQLVEALTVALPAHRMGSSGGVRETVEAVADRVLIHPDVVRLTSPDRPDVRHGGVRYSTWWTLRTEQGVLDTVETGRTAGVAVVEEGQVSLAASELGADQAAAVSRLCGGGERVAVLVGPAGSGKSRTLGAARQAWDAAGIRVRGVAPSAVAAGVLGEQAGIPSETLAKFLLEQSRGRDRVGRGEVIVCDEASMVATRDLAQLVLLAERSEAKVVLVGDHHQLGSVDAGGLFRLLATDAATAELTGVHRFANPWEADATPATETRPSTPLTTPGSTPASRAGG
jgi:conjugative relaxase-like TrwC/TraI family protein